jgi:hypothetical protein
VAYPRPRIMTRPRHELLAGVDRVIIASREP